MAYEELKRAKAKAEGKTEAEGAKEMMKAPKSDGLVDMKMSKAEVKEKNSPSQVVSSESGRYPYGLELRLDDDSVSKLGIDLPDVGTEVSVTAKGKVQSAESRDSADGGKRLSCCIQITKLKVG